MASSKRKLCKPGCDCEKEVTPFGNVTAKNVL